MSSVTLGVAAVEPDGVVATGADRSEGGCGLAVDVLETRARGVKTIGDGAAGGAELKRGAIVVDGCAGTRDDVVDGDDGGGKRTTAKIR